MANGECRMEVARPKRTVVTLFDMQKFHKLRSPYRKINTPTMNVCLRVLAYEDKRNTRYFQLKDVPRFLVTTALLANDFTRQSQEIQKFRNLALDCSFRMKPLQLNAAEHEQNHITRHRRSSLNGAGIIDQLRQLIINHQYSNPKFLSVVLYLIQLWWQFFRIFVYGNVVYAQTLEVLTLKNCIEPP